MYYRKTKRAKIGKCNICLETGGLSWDHVPPQGCSNSNQIEIVSLFEKLTGQTAKAKPQFSQNGLKYRTICGKCNSLLGGKYDDELNKFVNAILRFVNSNLIFPSAIKINAKPVKIIKSIVGHFLAAKKEIDKSKIDIGYRSFILDETVPIPDSLNLYYWVYPSGNTILMRDFTMFTMKNDKKKFAFFQLLKFFPIAFLLTEANNYYGLTSMTKFIDTKDLESEVEIPVLLNNDIDLSWPEKVDDDHIILWSKETSNAVFVKDRNTNYKYNNID